MSEPTNTEPAAKFPSSDTLGFICLAAGAVLTFAVVTALAAGHGSDWLALAVAVLFLATPNRWEPR